MRIDPAFALKGVALSAALLMAAGCQTTSIYTAKVTLGDEMTLTGLYSYPNGQSQPQTLAQTIDHYLTQTVQRDGFSDAEVTVTAGPSYTATITSANADVVEYQNRVPRFLTTGQQAYVASERIEADGKWNDAQWRFFLPLGLAMVNTKSVQLLHFPPDYSLPDQDYLNSKTSQRWEELLVANGATAGETSLYETIVDIAPIAAPASAGSQLSPTYPYYEQYDYAMLAFQVAPHGGNTGLPVVAYGGPVRDWIKNTFGYYLPVLGTNSLTLGEVNAPVLGSNHPSYFWYVAQDNCDKGWEVMRTDLIAAFWQRAMGDNPSFDPAATVTAGQNYWGESRYPQICELVRKQSSACASQPMTNCP